MSHHIYHFFIALYMVDSDKYELDQSVEDAAVDGEDTMVGVEEGGNIIDDQNEGIDTTNNGFYFTKDKIL